MRLRNIPKARDAIAESEFCVDDPYVLKRQWSKSFSRDNPVYIEIGTGKGQFILEQSRRHPDINFVGIEYYSSVLYRALEKLVDDPRDNLLLLRFDANGITEIFDESEVSRIYLNFSDPWPKERHAKRRLTSQIFLDRYSVILKSAGQIEFKTDNVELFDFSVEAFDGHPDFELDLVSRDLHSDAALMADNVMTEYEERFSSEGHSIYKLAATRI